MRRSPSARDRDRAHRDRGERRDRPAHGRVRRLAPPIRRIGARPAAPPGPASAHDRRSPPNGICNRRFRRRCRGARAYGAAIWRSGSQRRLGRHRRGGSRCLQSPGPPGVGRANPDGAHALASHRRTSSSDHRVHARGRGGGGVHGRGGNGTRGGASRLASLHTPTGPRSPSGGSDGTPGSSPGRLPGRRRALAPRRRRAPRRLRPRAHLPHRSHRRARSRPAR